MAWVRMAMPTLILGGWMVHQNIRFFRGNYKILMVASSLNTIRLYFFFIAYIYTSLSNAVLVFYTWPIFATVFSHFILKEEISKRQVAILGAAFTGILMVYAGHTFSFENSDFIGISAALAGAFFYSLMVIIFKSESQNYRIGESIFYQNFVGAIFYLPFILTNFPTPTKLDWALSMTHGIGIGVIVFYCFFYGLKRLKASTTSMITYLEIISAVTIGIIFFDDVLTWNMILGGLIIIGATSLLKLQD